MIITIMKTFKKSFFLTMISVGSIYAQKTESVYLSIDKFVPFDVTIKKRHFPI